MKSDKQPRRKRSLYREHFTDTEDPNILECIHCGAELDIGNGMSGLKYHTDALHPNSQVLSRADISRHDKAKSSLLVWAARTGFAANKVNDSEFINFVQLLDPKFRPPSSSELYGSILDREYERFRSELLEETKGQYLSIGTDHWNEPSSGRSMMGATAHWVTEDFRMESRVISVSPLEGSHNSQQVKSFIESLRQELRPAEIVSVVTDSARVMQAGKRIADVTSVDCAAHAIHNTVLKAGEGWREGAALTKKIRDIATHLGRSYKDSALLNEHQQKYGLPEVKIPIDVKTRWGSELRMKTMAFRNVMPLNDFLNSQRKSTVSAIEKSILENQIVLLEDFEEASKRLSLESASYSDTLPYFVSLKNVLEEYDRSDPSDAIAPYVTNLIAQFSHRLQRYLDDSLVHKVSLVDPRYSYDLKLMTKAMWEEADKSMLDELRMMPRDKSNTGTMQAEDEPVSKRPRRGLLGKLYGDAAASISKPSDPIEVEWRQYKEAVAMSRPSLSSSPLEWWASHKMQFPTIAKMARRLFSIKPTSVPVERLFSVVGVISRDKLRNRLSMVKMMKLITIACLSKTPRFITSDEYNSFIDSLNEESVTEDLSDEIRD